MNVQEPATLATIIVGFTANILAFRLAREARMKRKWVPWADRMLIGGSVVALGFVILPTVVSQKMNPAGLMPRAACAAVLVMLGGYFFAILAHYRLVFGRDPKIPREAGEPAEKIIVWITLVVAVCVVLVVICKSPCI